MIARIGGRNRCVIYADRLPNINTLGEKLDVELRIADRARPRPVKGRVVTRRKFTFAHGRIARRNALLLRRKVNADSHFFGAFRQTRDRVRSVEANPDLARLSRLVVGEPVEINPELESVDLISVPLVPFAADKFPLTSVRAPFIERELSADVVRHFKIVIVTNVSSLAAKVDKKIADIAVAPGTFMIEIVARGNEGKRCVRKTHRSAHVHAVRSRLCL